jgi:hypothetical protein
MTSHIKSIDRVCRWAATTLVVFSLMMCSLSAADEAEDAAARQQAAQSFLNANLSKSERLAAAQKLGYPDKNTFARLLEVGKDKRQDDEIRWEALKRHPWSNDWVKVVQGILNDPDDGGEFLDANLVKNLSQKTVRLPNAEMRQAIQRTYRQLLDDKRDKVREGAYFVLVSTEDSVAVARLVEGLKDGGANCPVSLNHAIEMIDAAGATRHFNTLRPYLKHEDPRVKAEAARVLAADATSRPEILTLIENSETPVSVRVQALRGMGRYDEQLSSYAIRMIRNKEESPVVRDAAMQAMVGQVNSKRLSESVEVDFAEAIEAFSKDPGLTDVENGKLQKQAATTLQNLQKSSPVIKRHYDQNR